MMTIDQIQVQGRRVMVRCDFNVPTAKTGEIADDTRIKKSLSTINYLIDRGAKVILISHFSSPKKQKSINDKNILKRFFIKREEGSMYKVSQRLSQLLGKQVDFINDCVGKKVASRIAEMKMGDVLLLENLRFYKEEEENSEEFGKQLASLSDVYVNDAFSVSHRKHTSVYQVPKFIPSVSGIQMQSEINVLDRVRRGADRPIVAIIGGAKIESKLSAIRDLPKVVDHLLIGGKIANAILVVRGVSIGRTIPEEKIINVVNETDFTSSNIHIPVDVIASPEKSGTAYIRDVAPGQVRQDEDIFDIGPETIEVYKQIISEAKTIIWAGPLGLFEESVFENGTRQIAEAVINNKEALKIAGGGDTLNALSRFGFLEEMDYVSGGGGAMLAFVSGGLMPGLENL